MSQLHPTQQIHLIAGITLRVCHILVGARHPYWYVRYTDECGVRQKVYLGKHLPPDGQIEDRVRQKSPGLFAPSLYSSPHRGAAQTPSESSVNEASPMSYEQQQEQRIFRCCRCGEHPTEDVLFAICARCRSEVTTGSHYRKQSVFRHPKSKEG